MGNKKESCCEQIVAVHVGFVPARYTHTPLGIKNQKFEGIVQVICSLKFKTNPS